jgi:quercetin dioxygenase-like cupin family protein
MNGARSSVALAAVIALVPCAPYAEGPAQGLMMKPADIQWKPSPRVPGLEAAEIIGNSAKPGLYVQRVKFPAGQAVQAHSHPDDRTYTVISGTWYIGWGDKFDESKLTALPPGSLYTEPAKVVHFIKTKEDVVVQVTGMGPTATDFVDPAHAPNK